MAKLPLKIKNLFKRHGFFISVFLIILSASFLRFYNYENRLVFGYDQVFGQLNARHAVKTFSLPLLGPFSSAGPFQTGGEWYWFVMLGSVFILNSYLSPWMFLTLVYVLFVFLMILFGSELINKKFGIILGLLAAVSPSQISQGVNLTNQSPIAILSLFSVWSGLRYLRSGKGVCLFLLGFFSSLAASIHLQGVILLLIVPSLFLVKILYGFKTFQKEGLSKDIFVIYIKKIVLLFLFIFLGVLLPLIPIFISDLSHDFFNFRNMFYYYVFEQNKISYEVLGRRWLTYVTVFIPENWGYIIGGNKYLGYFLSMGSLVLVAYLAISKKIKKEIILITLGFFMMVFLLRYTRTPLFESYVMFLHPFVFILTAYFLLEIMKKKVFLGMFFLSIVLLSSMINDLSIMSSSKNYELDLAKKMRDKILEKYPDKKFAVYNYQNMDSEKSLSLSLMLDVQNKMNDEGFKVGVVKKSNLPQKEYEVIWEDEKYKILNLGNIDSLELSKDWYFHNPSSVYSSTQEWFKKN